MITSNIIKVFIPAAATFAVGIAFAPVLTHYLFKYRVWKKVVMKTALDGTPAVEFAHLRTTKHSGTETSTPRMGGILIWASVLFVTMGSWALARFTSMVSPRVHAKPPSPAWRVRKWLLWRASPKTTATRSKWLGSNMMCLSVATANLAN